MGFIFFEDYSLLDAIYMTVITLSTVGFNEVSPLSPHGQIFTSILIVFNLGIFTYAIATISGFVVNGEFNKFLQYRKMHKKIQSMQQHVIICGFGRYGQEIASHFDRHDEPYLIIDQNQDLFDIIQGKKDSHFINGDATNDETLEYAGIRKAKAIISALPEDTDNVYVVLTARQLNPNIKIISRATYAKATQKLKRAGADHVIMPNQIGGSYMATLVTKPDAVEFFTIITERGDGLVHFEEVIFDELPEGRQQQTIKELNIRQNTGANIVGIKKPDGTYIVNPSADTQIEIHMGIIVLGTKEQIHRFESYMTKILQRKP